MGINFLFKVNGTLSVRFRLARGLKELIWTSTS